MPEDIPKMVVSRRHTKYGCFQVQSALPRTPHMPCHPKRHAHPTHHAHPAYDACPACHTNISTLEAYTSYLKKVKTCQKTYQTWSLPGDIPSMVTSKCWPTPPRTPRTPHPPHTSPIVEIPTIEGSKGSKRKVYTTYMFTEEN